ncbi:MAG: ATP-binding cassette domain-containing protein [Ruminococcus sp.]|nr:ATP-binding cassette domain-containing protein [Ruminococcus sp.]
MLQLKGITKQYGQGDNIVNALNGVDITFRKNEFVAILGHSGCGKTTMLNIIGGLDHYTDGDLIINGVSTKKYKDRDWDAYRNHSIGFIFQSYNLIPHQTVLSNVELALTISGVSKSERRKRAKEALEKVGLGDQIHKKPNQMSGGQMQRVAIARALINNPDILLADEPTGALDSETSIQVMELLKEIAKDKLVIMVTHNPELADDYATRIVKIKDGKLTSDSDPYTPEEEKENKEAKKQRVSMSFLTALSLSMNNLMTKKGRTLLTSFAGSIGIIGIALILALSTGINDYINAIQEETLSSYPLSITRETADTASMMADLMATQEEKMSQERDENTVYANTDVYDMFNSFTSAAIQVNNMKNFKTFLDTNEVVQDNATSVAYSYDIQMPIFTQSPSGEIVKSDFMEMYMKALGMDEAMSGTAFGSSAMMEEYSSMMSLAVWEELLPAENGDGVHDLLKNQYDVIYGQWPDEYNEVVVVLTPNNEIPDIIMYALGLKDEEKFGEILEAVMNGEEISDYGQTSWTFDELMNQKFKLILPCEYYQKNEAGNGYIDLTENSTGLEFLYNSEDIGTELKISGFIRPNEEVSSTMLTGFIGYPYALTEHIINVTNDSDIVKAQLADETIDVISGNKFRTDDYTGPTAEEMTATAKDYISGCDTAGKAEVYSFIMSQPDEAELNAYIEQTIGSVTREELAQQLADGYATQIGMDSASVLSYLEQMDDETFYGYASEGIALQYTQQYAQQVMASLSTMTAEQLAGALDATPLTDAQYELIFNQYTPEQISDYTYDEILRKLGKADFDDPSTIRIFTASFEDKDEIADAIADYNNSVPEDDQIHYTDFVALLMSSVTSIITGISYLLIAFVGISLVVSSIMIGIITYISVLERTREIGILRAIGASKKDISRVFNAETLIVGLTSGLIGVGVSCLLTIPINAIIHALTDLDNLNAVVPVAGAVTLVIISMVLTLIAGVIPSRVAAKKDPVEALRTE